MTVRMRHTPSHTKNRRSHHALSVKGMVSCSKCGTRVMPHTICMHCGYYRGREVVDVLKNMTKKEQRARQAKES